VLGISASAAFSGVACGDSGTTGAGGGTSGTGGSGTATVTAGSGGGASGGGGAAPIFVPTPADVDFEAVAALPTGEQIVFNDWDASPNELLSMAPDGSNVTTVFRAFRIWSFGVSRATDRIAFAAGDPDQQAHYGLDLGDAIQPTFVYSTADQSAENLTAGNLNDECHHFGPGDAYLYLCRRYDFTTDGMGSYSNKGYRIGRVDLATRAFEYLADEDPSSLTLSAQPTPDETEILFDRVPVPGTRKVVRRAIGGGSETSVKSSAGFPVLSDDGATLLVTDYTQTGALVAVDAGGTETVVAEGPNVSSAKLSPDGTRVVFLRWDDAAVCSHVEIAKLDGSESASPTRIYDCAESGRNITDVAWITH
jgi:hypothetical protein